MHSLWQIAQSPTGTQLIADNPDASLQLAALLSPYGPAAMAAAHTLAALATTIHRHVMAQAPTVIQKCVNILQKRSNTKLASAAIKCLVGLAQHSSGQPMQQAFDVLASSIQAPNSTVASSLLGLLSAPGASAPKSSAIAAVGTITALLDHRPAAVMHSISDAAVKPLVAGAKNHGHFAVACLDALAAMCSSGGAELVWGGLQQGNAVDSVIGHVQLSRHPHAVAAATAAARLLQLLVWDSAAICRELATTSIVITRMLDMVDDCSELFPDRSPCYFAACALLAILQHMQGQQLAAVRTAVEGRGAGIMKRLVNVIHSQGPAAVGASRCVPGTQQVLLRLAGSWPALHAALPPELQRTAAQQGEQQDRQEGAVVQGNQQQQTQQEQQAAQQKGQEQQSKQQPAQLLQHTDRQINSQQQARAVRTDVVQPLPQEQEAPCRPRAAAAAVTGAAPVPIGLWGSVHKVRDRLAPAAAPSYADSVPSSHFRAAGAYEGARPGYVFRKGSQGLRYYASDRHGRQQLQSGLKRQPEQPQGSSKKQHTANQAAATPTAEGHLPGALWQQQQQKKKQHTGTVHGQQMQQGEQQCWQAKETSRQPLQDTTNQPPCSSKPEQMYKAKQQDVAANPLGCSATAAAQQEVAAAPAAAGSAAVDYMPPINIQHQQEQNVDQQQLACSDGLGLGSSSNSGSLGPIGRALARKLLGALPCQQQLVYWQLADQPFDSPQLQQLVQHYLTPRQALQFGKAPIRCRIRQHYPLLAPKVLQLQAASKQQEQQLSSLLLHHDSTGLPSSGNKEQSRAATAACGGAPDVQISAADPPAAVELLLLLRCVQLWESRQASQPDMPALLQKLAGLGNSTAAGPDGDDVQEVLDLTGDSDGEEAEQQQMLENPDSDVLLVKEVLGRQQHRG